MAMNLAIGVDLGGTCIKYALVDENGTIYFESSKPTQADKGREAVIENLKDCLTESNSIGINNGFQIVGAGVGTPGIIDNGLVLGGAENLPDWESFPLGGILNRKFEFPVYVDNDANLMGLGEIRFGANKEFSDVVFLTIGIRIGGAMVLNGKLYGGHRNRGAKLGHIIINNNGEKCSCGATGCLEAHASVNALIRDYKNLLLKNNKDVLSNINGKFIVQQYLNNEEEAEKALNLHFDYLAVGIAGFINIFSPQKVIIGSDIAEQDNFYIEGIRKRTLKIAMNETQIFTEITAAQFGNKAGFLGAAALVFENLKTE